MLASNTINKAGKREEDSEQKGCSTSKKQKVEYDVFVRNGINCFKSEEYGSVYFSCFNPVWPILGCGLSDGKVLIIEGKRQADLVSIWENKTWNKVNAMSAMTDLGWNMDGSLLLTAFLDGQIVLWNKNIKTSMEIKDPSGEQVWAATWNPFLPTIFATRSDQTVLIWDHAHNQPETPKQRFAYHSSLLRDLVWISEDQFFSCSDGGFILLCQIGIESPIKSFDHEDAVLSLSWNSTLNLLGCLSRNGSIMVWSIETNEPIYLVKNERMKRPTCLAWYLDDDSIAESSWIACGLEDGSVVLWDSRGNSDPVLSLPVQTNSIWDVSFSPDGLFLASIDLQGNLVIWTTKTWQIVFQSNLSFRASKRILQWGAGGRKLAIANPSEQIHLIEAVELVKNKH
ncbi:F-box-like/WD repeat-containing protein TBL1XR1 [Daphnia carinata]|uniref:F-box-like/WD repeat-containing protein TBL1XR1 n=1 Tax=Daphnia carinata TaxID=120202 RepID=UPI00257DB18F|nr:F-box-like/WD repeat-containing protein TBL1XR1 [Daphnia carinata]